MNVYAGRVANLLESYFVKVYAEFYKENDDYLLLISHLFNLDAGNIKSWRETETEHPLGIFHKNHVFPDKAIPLVGFRNFFEYYRYNYLSGNDKRDLVVTLMNNFLRLNQDYIHPDARYVLIPDYRLCKTFNYKADIFLGRVQNDKVTPIAIVKVNSVNNPIAAHLDRCIGQLTRYRAHFQQDIIFCNFGDYDDIQVDKILDIKRVLTPFTFAVNFKDLLFHLCHAIERDLSECLPII